MKFRLNRHLQVLDIGDFVVAANGFTMQRAVFHKPIGIFMRAFAEEAMSEEEFLSLVSPEKAEMARRLFGYLSSKELIVAESFDEVTSLRSKLQLERFAKAGSGSPASFSLDYTVERYMNPAPLTAGTFLAALAGQDARVALRPLKVSIVGGCVVAVLKDRLEETGIRFGYQVEATVDMPRGADTFRKIVERDSPQVIAYQPSVAHLLEPLWGRGFSVSDSERRSRMELLKDSLSLHIAALKTQLQGRLGLVHNISSPSIDPFGRSAFRLTMNFRELLAELNAHIEKEIRDEPNLFLLDEDLLVRRHGAFQLLDEAQFHLSHHGGRPDLNFEDFVQRPELGAAFAEEYLACYQAWSGSGKIKCVIVDLDNTMWPGIQAEDGIAWLEKPSNTTYLHFGIHEALRFLRRRGVLLVSCSKNSEEATLGDWKRAAEQSDMLLHPDEFVMHKINWEAKSKNIADAASALELGLDSVLFIDDNPVERDEVSRALPRIRVLGSDMSSVRKALLTDPALDINLWTEEAAQRSTMVKAQIARDSARKSAVSESEFLRSLDIRIKVSHGISDGELSRVTELIQRTNQFNTSLERYDARTISALAGPSGDANGATGKSDRHIWTLRVKDRFVDYGLVGAMIMAGRTIPLFVMSCRVIGLKVAVPFLVTALKGSGLDLARVRAKVVEGPRNHPARDLFELAGFARIENGLYELPEASSLADVDPLIYRNESE
jgi:FkbH-like protein